LQSLETTPGAELGQFEFSPDGELLAGVGFVPPGPEREAGQVIDVWRLSDGTRLRTLRPDENNYSFVDMVFTANGLLKVLSQQIYDIRLDTWNVRTGERIDRITELPGIDRQDRIGRLSPDGEYYFVRSDVAGTRLINIQTRTVTYLGGYVEQETVFNATGDYLAIASLEDVQIFSQVEP
jgi:WD40 repeat protein